MIDAKATYIDTDRHYQDGLSIHWFDVVSDDYRIESGEYGVAHTGDDLTPLDSDGAPIDYNDLLAYAVIKLYYTIDEG